MSSDEYVMWRVRVLREYNMTELSQQEETKNELLARAARNKM